MEGTANLKVNAIYFLINASPKSLDIAISNYAMHR